MNELKGQPGRVSDEKDSDLVRMQDQLRARLRANLFPAPAPAVVQAPLVPAMAAPIPLERAPATSRVESKRA